MKKRKIAISVLVTALLIAWYAFRPERLFINRNVNEQFPQNGGALSQTLLSGRFHSVVHPTEGTATIYQMSDGSRMLRFTNFRTSNGPNVHIYLLGADDATDSSSVRSARFIDLGPMKGNIGDQNYSFGPDVDLSQYRAVSVWCERFSVNFGTAPLMLNQSRSSSSSHE